MKAETISMTALALLPVALFTRASCSSPPTPPREVVSSGEGAAAVVARAPKGGEPGGLAAETIQVTGKIIAIDVDKRTITLQFEDGGTESFPARPDNDLTRLKLGEQVLFRVTEMIAIWVEKQP